MPKAVAQSKQHRKQNGQKQYHSWNACTSTSNTSRQGPRSKSSLSSRSQHNTELTAGFTAQPMRRRFYEEQDEGERVQQKEMSGYFRRSPVKTRSGVGDIPKQPASAAQSRSDSSEGRGRGGYWRTSPVQTRSGRRTSRHPPSASQSRSDSRERAGEATTSKAGEHHGNSSRDQDAGTSTLQHGTNHNTRSSVKHPHHWQSASHSGISGETTRRAPHRRSPIQTRSSSHSHSQGTSSYAQAANSLRKQSTQMQPRAKAAQRKKNSSKQVSVNVSQAGTSRGTAVRQRPGTAQSTCPTSSRPQKSSGARQGNRKTAVPTRGKALPAERKTGRKANGTTATPRGGTAQSGERKRGVKQTKVATQTKGKKRTGSQAFGSQGSQATAEAGIAVKGIKQTGTVKSAKKQNERPTTAEATKKQKIAAEPDCCPICLSELATQQLAHPDVCRHVFCLGCLQTWQQRRNTCPIDNKQFQTLVLCGLDGKDQMPVVENQNDRNGVAPAGNQPYIENRSDAGGQMDHYNDQRGYAGPGNWGYDERGWDDSSSLPDDEEYLPTFASIFEDDTYDDPGNWRDDQRGWYDMPSIEPPPAFDDYPSDDDDDDDDSTVIPISSDSERRDTNVNGGSEHSDQGDWVIACRYRRAPEERDNSHLEDWDDGHGSRDDYHGDWGTEEGNSDSDQGDWVVGCDFTRAPEEWDNSHHEDWDDGHGSRDDYHGDWGTEEGHWDDEQEEQDDGQESWDYDDERSHIVQPYQGAHFAHWGAGSAYWSNGQRQSGDAQPDWARRYDMWAYQQSQIWNGYDYGSGYHQQAHWQWPRWWSDSSSSDDN